MQHYFRHLVFTLTYAIMPNRSKINKSELQMNLTFSQLFSRLLLAKKQTIFLKGNVKLQKS